MRCAVAIVLAFIGMSLANPVPSGLGGLTYPQPVLGESRSSFINHGVSIPVVKVPIVSLPILPIVKPVYSIIKPVVLKDYGYGLH